MAIGFQKSLDLQEKLVGVLEVPVHGREADVGDSVKRLELFHDPFPDLLGIHLRVSTIDQGPLYAQDDLFELFLGNRSFLACERQSLQKFMTVEGFAPAVLFLDDRQRFLNPFIGCEASSAGAAEPPPSNPETVFRQAGIAHLRVGNVTEGTFHRKGSRRFTVSAKIGIDRVPFQKFGNGPFHFLDRGFLASALQNPMDQFRDFTHFGRIQSSACRGGSPEPDPARNGRGLVVERHGILVAINACLGEIAFRILAGQAFAP